MKPYIQVVQHLRPGGIETMALDLLARCEPDETGYILSLEGSREEALARWPRLAPVADRLIFFGKPAGFRPGVILRLARLFREMKAHCVHTHHIGPLLYAGIAARLAGVPYRIHTEHDAWHLNDPKRRNLQRKVLWLARPHLVADAETVAEGMRRNLGREDFLVIPNGIDTDRFQPGDRAAARQALGLPANAKLVGCSGRLEEVKGQKVLLQALALLPEGVHVALAGIGSTEAALRTLAQELGIADRVHFLGRIDAMPTFYQALDLFCLPSFQEGMPLSPLEAQACGIPALVTDAGGSRETLCPDSGRLVPVGDPAAMSKVMDAMLEQVNDANPRAFVEQHGDLKRMAQAYGELRRPPRQY